MEYTKAYITVWNGEGTLVLERGCGEPYAVTRLKEKGFRVTGAVQTVQTYTEHDLNLSLEKQEKLNYLKNAVIYADYGKNHEHSGTYALSKKRMAELGRIIKEE